MLALAALVIVAILVIAAIIIPMLAAGYFLGRRAVNVVTAVLVALLFWQVAAVYFDCRVEHLTAEAARSSACFGPSGTVSHVLIFPGGPLILLVIFGVRWLGLHLALRRGR